MVNIKSMAGTFTLVYKEEKLSKEYYGHPDFYALIEELKDIHSRKNHDYAGDDPLSNFRMSEKMGVPAWKGILIRLSDKFSRLCSFAKKEEYKVKDENIEDTLKDMAIYSILCILLYRERDHSEDIMQEYIEQVKGIKDIPPNV